MSIIDLFDQVGLDLRTAGLSRWLSGVGAGLGTALLVGVTAVANGQATEAANAFDSYEATTVSIRATHDEEAAHLAATYADVLPALRGLPGVRSVGASWVHEPVATLSLGGSTTEQVTVRAADVAFVEATEGVIQGHLPGTPDSLLAGADDDHGLQPGMLVELDNGPVTVSGVIDHAQRAGGLEQGITLIRPPTDAQPDDLNVLFAVEPGSAEAVALEAAALLGSGDPHGLQLSYRPGVGGLAEKVLAAVSGLTMTATAGVLALGGFMIGAVQYVSVLGRSRELGWMMALGASPTSLALRTALESGLLGLLSGGIGVVLALTGLLGASLLGAVPVVVDPAVVMLAAPTAGAVALFAGLVPALWVARLDPVDAIGAA